MKEGGDPNAIGGNRSPGVNAASQETIFIVSGSPSNPIFGEVTQMLCWGNNSPGG